MFTVKRIGLTKWGKPWLRYEKKGFEAFEATYKEIEEILLPKVVEALK